MDRRLPLPSERSVRVGYMESGIYSVHSMYNFVNSKLHILVTGVMVIESRCESQALECGNTVTSSKIKVLM